jgi:hypothetical protein
MTCPTNCPIYIVCQSKTRPGYITCRDAKTPKTLQFGIWRGIKRMEKQERVLRSGVLEGMGDDR